MAYKYNPFTGTLDEVGAGGGGGTPGGSTTQVQFNDGGAFGGDADLTWNKTTNVLGVTGDVNLSDGGTYTTTLQTITPTANRTISLPDATGTVALVAGSSGQFVYNNAGAYAGVSTMTFSGNNVTLAGRLINSYTSVADSPAKVFTGTWFTGGTATTTKPHLLIEPTGTSSGAWSPSGTGLGVNAASTFSGNLLDLQLNGTSRFAVTSTQVNLGAGGIQFVTNATDNGSLTYNLAGGTRLRLDSGGIRLQPTGQLRWNPLSNLADNDDLILSRDAAGTLAQRNGTNAQTFRVYNTYTDASNYQRTSLTDSSTGLVIDQQFAGTGVVRTNLLDLQVNGTSRVKVTSGGNIYMGAQNTGLEYYNNGLLLMANNSYPIFVEATRTRFAPTHEIAWAASGGTSYGIAADIGLVRSGTNTVKVTNGSSGDGTISGQLRSVGTAPATASSTGTAGDIRYDASFVYICTATNTWKRAAITTW
jgi:hypothetical protein